ncbi:MAG: n-acetylglutamate synthase [Bdellovibrionota bacterium]
MFPFSLHQRVFRAQSNSPNGQVGSETRFHYEQDGTTISASYAGGAIARGALLGSIDENGCLLFSYHHLSITGELHAGICRSTPEVLSDGRLRFHERWRWTTGDCSEGESVIEEIR